MLPTHKLVCVEGFEPSAFRFQVGHSNQTELHTDDGGELWNRTTRYYTPVLQTFCRYHLLKLPT